jgi:hypothetical protein|tara:strand:+ start:9335 stop:9799 length:465 start_codon:yes stop_codon:yes gene_type:complete
MRLSENLKLEECIKSNTASRLGIDNSPTEEHTKNLKLIAEKIFQPIREHFGVPIYISSGYRSESLNKAIGGSKTSQHCHGQALDIDQDNRNSKVSNRDIFDYIMMNLEFDQLIYEFGDAMNPAWVHVSYSEEKNRNRVLQAYKDNGKTRYKVYG